IGWGLAVVELAPQRLQFRGRVALERRQAGNHRIGHFADSRDFGSTGPLWWAAQSSELSPQSGDKGLDFRARRRMRPAARISAISEMRSGVLSRAVATGFEGPSRTAPQAPGMYETRATAASPGRRFGGSGSAVALVEPN